MVPVAVTSGTEVFSMSAQRRWPRTARAEKCRPASIRRSNAPEKVLATNAGICEKDTPPEKKALGQVGFLSKHRISGRRALSAAWLQGKGHYEYLASAKTIPILNEAMSFIFEPWRFVVSSYSKIVPCRVCGHFWSHVKKHKFFFPAICS